MSISRVLFRSDGPLTSQLGAFPVRWPPNLETLAKPFAPVIVQMGQAGRRAS